MQNYQYYLEPYHQKWSRLAELSELRVLGDIYSELERPEKAHPYEILTKMKQIKQKYTFKLNNTTRSRNSKVMMKVKEMIERPKSAREAAVELGNAYSFANRELLKRSPSTMTCNGNLDMHRSSFQMTQKIGNDYSIQNRERFEKSPGQTKQNEVKDQPISLLKFRLEEGKKYGNEHGMETKSRNSEHFESHVTEKKIRNPAAFFLAQRSRDYGNYQSKRNRMKIIEQFSDKLETSSALREDYERTRQQISDFEIKYNFREEAPPQTNELVLKAEDKVEVDTDKKIESPLSETAKRTILMDQLSLVIDEETENQVKSMIKSEIIEPEQSDSDFSWASMDSNMTVFEMEDGEAVHKTVEASTVERVSSEQETNEEKEVNEMKSFDEIKEFFLGGLKVNETKF